MSRITTVIFDVYETLAHNNVDLWVETFRGICRDQGLVVDHRELYREWKVLEMVFRKERLNFEEPEKSPPFKSYEEAWRDCFDHAFSRLGLSGDAEAAARDCVRDMGLREPYPDAVEVLPLVQSEWRTGVLSNADDGYLLPLLGRLGWEFETVVSSERARAYKPLSSPFRQVMDELGVASEEAVYVGDTLYDDILGAKHIGMRTVWVNRNAAARDPELPKPDYELRELGALAELLKMASRGRSRG